MQIRGLSEKQKGQNTSLRGEFYICGVKYFLLYNEQTKKIGFIC